MDDVVLVYALYSLKYLHEKVNSLIFGKILLGFFVVEGVEMSSEIPFITKLYNKIIIILSFLDVVKFETIHVIETEAKQSEELGNYLIEALKGNKIFEYTGLILEFTLPDDEIPPTMIPISRPDPALGPDVAMLTLTEYQLWIRKNNSRKYLHERNRCIYLIS